MAVPIEHLDGQHEVFSLVRVGYVKGLGGTVLLAVVEVELLHVLVGVADADEGAQLRRLLGLSLAQHALASQPPPITEQVDARRRAEEALLVAVRLLRHLGMQDHHDHVGAVAQVPLHGLACEAALLGAVGAGAGPGRARVASEQRAVLRGRRRAVTRPRAVLVRHARHADTESPPREQHLSYKLACISPELQLSRIPGSSFAHFTLFCGDRSASPDSAPRLPIGQWGALDYLRDRCGFLIFTALNY